ncbi:UNVERIFIED_CONTAM: hypothetical protein PYX00_000791 [Menopon gallinae]|uniref:Uncharacterized protein n=1 Tax=Menopon gallinae TaxID=328185 RepID=A0AAW2IB73_9NEOP
MNSLAHAIKTDNLSAVFAATESAGPGEGDTPLKRIVLKKHSCQRPSAEGLEQGMQTGEENWRVAVVGCVSPDYSR